MKDFRDVYKKKASDNMADKYGVVIPTLLIVGSVSFVIQLARDNFVRKYTFDLDTFTYILTDPGKPEVAFLLNVIAWVLATLFLYGTTMMFIQTARNQMPQLEVVLTKGFQEQQIKSLALSFLTGLYLFLWSLLLIIPGIIKSYAYSMGFYLIYQEPEITASEAIALSDRLTRGNKFELFLLDLSYLGWYILGIFTFGILWLWIVPKHMTARTLYFEELYNVYHPSQVTSTDDAFDRNTDEE